MNGERTEPGDAPADPAATEAGADAHVGEGAASNASEVAESGSTEGASTDSVAAVTRSGRSNGPRAGMLQRIPKWVGPALVMVVAVVAFMPKALTGQATYVAVDMMEPLSPLRDELGRAPHVESPVQTDQVEVVPNHVSFYENLREGRFQLWDPQHGLGTPLGTNPNMFVLSPLSLLLVAVPSWYALGLRVALLLLTAQVGTYLLSRRLGVARWLATIAGVAYAFNGVNIVFVHRVNVVYILPLFIWAIDKAVSRPTIRRLLVVGGIVAWMWLEGFPSAFVHAIYLGALWAAWMLYRRVRRELVEGAFTWRGLLTRVGGLAAALVWGLALSAVNLVYFFSFITSIGLLDQRGQDSNGHLGSTFIYNLFRSDIYGNFRDPADWWMFSNPMEAIGTVGAVTMVFAAAAAILAVSRRLWLTSKGRDAWGLLIGQAVTLILLTYIGTGALTVVYALPAMGDNPIHRIRFAIALPLVLMGALGADSFFRRGLARVPAHAGSGSPTSAAASAGKVPRIPGGGQGVPAAVSLPETPKVAAPVVTTAVWSVIAAICFVLPADDFANLIWGASRAREVAKPVIIGLLLAAAAIVLLLAARRWPRWAAAFAVLGAGVVWVDVALPLRTFTPEAPVEDFYPELPGHRNIRDLAGDEYRFAATAFDYYPNESTLHDIFDLRGATLRPERVKDFVELADEEAFERDWMKQILTRDEWNLASPVYDELGLRYFVVGTAKAPLGTPEVLNDGRRSGDLFATEAEPVDFELTVPAGTAGLGVIATAEGSGCDSSSLELDALVGGGGPRLEAGRPAMDATGDWVDFGLVAQEYPDGTRLMVSVGPDGPDCTVRVATSAGVPVSRVFVEEADSPVRLIDTVNGWVYERPGAKPIVRALTDWVPAEDAAAAREVFVADPSAAGVVGTDVEPDDPGAAATLTDTVFADNEVTTTVTSEATTVVTAVQSATTGWTVTVDGEAADLVELHGGFTAVVVPPGTHEVQFAFRPGAFYLGAIVSGLAIVAGVVLFLGDLWWRRRSPSTGTQGNAGAEVTLGGERSS